MRLEHMGGEMDGSAQSWLTCMKAVADCASPEPATLGTRKHSPPPTLLNPNRMQFSSSP